MINPCNFPENRRINHSVFVKTEAEAFSAGITTAGNSVDVQGILVFYGSYPASAVLCFGKIQRW